MSYVLKTMLHCSDKSRELGVEMHFHNSSELKV